MEKKQMEKKQMEEKQVKKELIKKVPVKKEFMQEKISLILPAGIFGFLAVLGLLTVLRLSEPVQLHDFKPSAHPGKMTCEAINSGEYQRDFAAWAGDVFFGHHFLLKTYNQFKYSLLKEAPGDCMVGRDGYLFSESQTGMWAGGRRCNPTTAEEYDTFAKQIRTLQDLLEMRGKAFFFLLTPVKAEICTQKLPGRYLFLADQYAEENGSIGQMLKTALDRYGVHYYDATDYLRETENAGKVQVFHNTGHHWTLDAVSMVLQECFRVHAKALSGIDLPSVSTLEQRDEIFHVDRDLYYLLNVFKGKLDEDYHIPEIVYDHRSQDRVFLYGTSFGYEIEQVLYQNGTNRAFEKLVSYMYFTNKNIYDESGMHTVSFTPQQDISELGIMEDVLGSSLVILEENNIFGVAGTHKKWVDYVVEKMNESLYKAGTDVMREDPEAVPAEFVNFYGKEDWGRWSEGNTCAVKIYSKNKITDGKDGVLSFTAATYGESRSCDILWNDKKIGSIVLDTAAKDYRLNIPEEYFLENKNLITFQLHGRIYAPAILEESSDSRNLGMSLSSLVIGEAQ